ncbi:MAG: hypothetical protein JW736_09620 [Deltaproteobacteria bacterium]|nr:hypothetical protein [Deltaproteobacteria bacterium]MBN2688044.1 hypothetical protein [Deltaproteobacteria bacterium]
MQFIKTENDLSSFMVCPIHCHQKEKNHVISFFEKGKTRGSAPSSEDGSEHCIPPQLFQHTVHSHTGTGVIIGKTLQYYSPALADGNRIDGRHALPHRHRTDINDIIDKVASLASNRDNPVSIYRKCNKYLWEIEDHDGKIGHALLDILLHQVSVTSETTKTVYIESDNMFVDIIAARRQRIKAGEYVKISLSMKCGVVMRSCRHYNFNTETNRDDTCHETAVSCIRACGGLFIFSADAKERVEITIFLPVPGATAPTSYRMQ